MCQITFVSRKKKTEQREPFDFYSTPSWTVDRLFEKIQFSTKGDWIEPNAGNGAIIKAIGKNKNITKPNKIWAVEIQEAFEEELRKTNSDVFIQDFLKFDIKAHAANKATLAIGNPPYKFALPIIQHALTQADTVCFLLRINFLASNTRAAWMTKNIPDVYVLPNRPKFVNNRSDACEYGWFVWGKEANGGKIVILDTTPEKERKGH